MYLLNHRTSNPGNNSISEIFDDLKNYLSEHKSMPTFISWGDLYYSNPHHPKIYKRFRGNPGAQKSKTRISFSAHDHDREA